MYVEYEEDGKTIKARVWQKVDTLANWEANTLVIGPGEQAFVVDSGGAPINFKIGDGTKRFSDLPWWIDYAGGQYVQVAGNALPTPTVELGYSFVGPGTYTHPGQPDIVAPDGRFSQIVWNGTSWVLKDMGELPVKELTDAEYMILEKYVQNGTPVYNEDGVLSTVNVIWDDAELGVLTYTNYNIDMMSFDGYTVTYKTKTLTQPKVTRDLEGNIIIKPLKQVI